MRCILHGHRVITDEGKGEFKGRTATYCCECGKVFSTNEGDISVSYPPHREMETLKVNR